MLLAQLGCGLFLKKSKEEQWLVEDMEFPEVGIKERPCGNTRGQIIIEREVEYTICGIC